VGQKFSSRYIIQLESGNDSFCRGNIGRSGSSGGSIILLFILLIFLLIFLLFIIRAGSSRCRCNYRSLSLLENEVHLQTILASLCTQEVKSISHGGLFEVHAGNLHAGKIVAITKHTLRGSHRLRTTKFNGGLFLRNLFLPGGVYFRKSLGTIRIICSTIVAGTTLIHSLLATAGGYIVRVNLDNAIELIIGCVIVGEVEVAIGKVKETIHLFHILDVLGGKSRIIALRVAHTGKLLTGTLVVGLTFKHIEQKLFSYDYMGASNMVDVYISYLRKKIDDGFGSKLIHTVRGVGYVLREEA
jgi:hypothetical protein